ncbi:hypothetical protein JHV675_51950 [Mycobacterium avium subsp. hominissuis]
MLSSDSAAARRSASGLSLDSTLLAELLGRVELRELLDPEVVARAGGADAVEVRGWLEGLRAARRAGPPASP